MKIVEICSAHSLDDDRVTRKQAHSLAKIGHDVTVCARHRFNIEIKNIRFINIDTKVDGIPIDLLKGESSYKTARFFRLIKLFQLVKNIKPNLVVCHEFETALLALVLKKLHDVPFVFDAHECFQETMPYKLDAKFASVLIPFARSALKSIALNAEAVTVVSPANQSYFKKLAPKTPVEVLHNSPILEYFPYKDEDSDPITIVHEGTLGFERGAIQILKAIAQVYAIQKIRFLVLGTIPKNVYTPFMEEIERLDIINAVTMPGRLPWTEFGKVEAKGQIGLICSQPIPNHLLSLSNKLYTYMACGLAVVGMKDSETAKIIEKYQCGLTVDATKPEEIAKAIQYMIEHPDERKQMAKNGRAAIENHLSWDHMETKMRGLYSRIETNLAQR